MDASSAKILTGIKEWRAQFSYLKVSGSVNWLDIPQG
jgi:hypothetical protein